MHQKNNPGEAAASYFTVDSINLRGEITTLCSATHHTDFPLQTLMSPDCKVNLKFTMKHKIS